MLSPPLRTSPTILATAKGSFRASQRTSSRSEPVLIDLVVASRKIASSRLDLPWALSPHRTRGPGPRARSRDG
ncbi:MAG: hypothetical protein IIB11_07660 [Chloroflexi bacterium]|nr:hypothetical protein [Chloroflexota bacterium]